MKYKEEMKLGEELLLERDYERDSGTSTAHLRLEHGIERKANKQPKLKPVINGEESTFET